eukprot:4163876-Pleurochrysis_carterae.AAC.1
MAPLPIRRAWRGAARMGRGCDAVGGCRGRCAAGEPPPSPKPPPRRARAEGWKEASGLGLSASHTLGAAVRP